MSGRQWVLRDGVLEHVRNENCTSDCKPVVVIDPEDREQVDALSKALVEAAYKHGNLVVSDQGIHPDTTAAALRSLIAPPKPEQPEGRYAVVEDDKAVEWVRAELVGVAQWHSIEGDRSRWSGWDRIAAVKVLSEGVTS